MFTKSGFLYDGTDRIYIPKNILISLQFLSTGTDRELKECESVKVLKNAISSESKYMGRKAIVKNRQIREQMSVVTHTLGMMIANDGSVMI